MRNICRNALALALVTMLSTACAELKNAGRTVGHTTKDVATDIGHASRDVAKDIGHGAKRVYTEAIADEDKES